MKIETNFSAMPGAPIKLFQGFLSGLALLSLLLCIWLIITTQDLSARSGEMQKLQAGLGKRISELNPVSDAAMPDSSEISDFSRKVALINSLDKGEGIHTARVLAKLEKLLPGTAWLISFRYQRESGEVTLTAEAGQTAPLALFLLRLENSDAFRDVLLVRQLRTGEGNKKRIQYSIKFTGRPQ